MIIIFKLSENYYKGKTSTTVHIVDTTNSSMGYDPPPHSLPIVANARVF